MNSLEFIDKEIRRYIAIIRITSGEKKSYYKQVVKQLKQIKTELETWYSIKSGFIYEEESKHMMSEEMRSAYTIYLTDDEIKTIQKNIRGGK